MWRMIFSVAGRATFKLLSYELIMIFLKTWYRVSDFKYQRWRVSLLMRRLSHSIYYFFLYIFPQYILYSIFLFHLSLFRRKRSSSIRIGVFWSSPLFFFSKKVTLHLFYVSPVPPPVTFFPFWEIIARLVYSPLFYQKLI